MWALATQYQPTAEAHTLADACTAKPGWVCVVLIESELAITQTAIAKAATRGERLRHCPVPLPCEAVNPCCCKLTHTACGDMANVTDRPKCSDLIEFCNSIKFGRGSGTNTMYSMWEEITPRKTVLAPSTRMQEMHAKSPQAVLASKQWFGETSILSFCPWSACWDVFNPAYRVADGTGAGSWPKGLGPSPRWSGVNGSSRAKPHDLCPGRLVAPDLGRNRIRGWE